MHRYRDLRQLGRVLPDKKALFDLFRGGQASLYEVWGRDDLSAFLCNYERRDAQDSELFLGPNQTCKSKQKRDPSAARRWLPCNFPSQGQPDLHLPRQPTHDLPRCLRSLR